MNMFNYQNSTPAGPIAKQLVLHSFFLMYYLVILIFLMNVLPYVYICLLGKKSPPLLIEGTAKSDTSGSIANSQGMLTEINVSNAIAKIRVWVESDAVKH